MINLGDHTNKGVALFKALHQRHADPLLRDPFSAWFLPSDTIRQLDVLKSVHDCSESTPESRFASIAYWYTIFRELYIDEQLRGALDTGCTQVLNLGAGFDTRHFRIVRKSGSNVHTFELDLPATIEEKKRCLAAHPEENGDRLTLVPFDLASDDLSTLGNFGFDPNKPTCVLAQGVFYYVGESTSRTILRFVRATCTAGTRICFDLCYPEMLDPKSSIPGIRWVENLKKKRGTVRIWSYARWRPINDTPFRLPAILLDRTKRTVNALSSHRRAPEQDVACVYRDHVTHLTAAIPSWDVIDFWRRDLQYRFRGNEFTLSGDPL